MAAMDFDYKTFANDLASQAQELVPQDFNDEQKQYVVNTLGNFSMMAGQALAEDPNLNFNEETSKIITQIIAEWSFHKSVDLVRSGIPSQHWDGVMRKIAYTIFEIAKQAFSQDLPSDKCLELVEHHVKRAYMDALTELKDKGEIDEELMQFAASQSNMEQMVQNIQQQQDSSVPPKEPTQGEDSETVSPKDLELPKIDSKAMKLATVAMLFKRMNQDKVQTILNEFEDDDAQAIIKYMHVPDLTGKIGPQNAYRCLQEIKTSLPKTTDFSESRLVSFIKKITNNLPAKQIDTLLNAERIGVKRLVFSALEGKYYDKLSPKVAGIVATHLKDSV